MRKIPTITNITPRNALFSTLLPPLIIKIITVFILEKNSLSNKHPWYGLFIRLQTELDVEKMVNYCKGCQIKFADYNSKEHNRKGYQMGEGEFNNESIY
jgi:hypothetical protein